jgi:membrane-associated phospholipid phosphatase
MAWLLNADKILFRIINLSLANPVTDFIMPVITNDWFLRMLLLLVVIALPVFGKREGWITALLCVITVIATDQLSSNLIKHLVERIRPCHVMSDVHLLVGCGGGLSFPSSHAANLFGQAAVIGTRHKKVSVPAYVFAALVGYSRIVVGVHYPGDVLGGGLLGMAVGLAIVGITRLIQSRFQPQAAGGKE